MTMELLLFRMLSSILDGLQADLLLHFPLKPGALALPGAGGLERRMGQDYPSLAELISLVVLPHGAT